MSTRALIARRRPLKFEERARVRGVAAGPQRRLATAALCAAPTVERWALPLHLIYDALCRVQRDAYSLIRGA